MPDQISTYQCSANMTTVMFAQPSQKRAFPQETSAKPSRGATRQTSQQSASVAAASVAASFGAADFVAVDD